MQNFDLARKNMVSGQIQPNNISDNNLLSALLAVPRHLFAPEAMKSLAYSEVPIYFDKNNYMAISSVIARMIQMLEATSDSKILVLGAKTGYSAAILSRLARKIIAIEENKELLNQAIYVADQLKLNNILFYNDNIYNCNLQNEPFDAIFIEGAIFQPTQNLLKQLTKKGKLVTGIINKPHLAEVTLYKKDGDSYFSQIMFEADLPYLFMN